MRACAATVAASGAGRKPERRFPIPAEKSTLPPIHTVPEAIAPSGRFGDRVSMLAWCRIFLAESGAREADALDKLRDLRRRRRSQAGNDERDGEVEKHSNRADPFGRNAK